jgi:hypothetical protein
LDLKLLQSKLAEETSKVIMPLFKIKLLKIQTS